MIYCILFLAVMFVVLTIQDIKESKHKCKHPVRYLREEKLIDMGRNKEFIYACGECHEEIVERAW